jgi:hypothetical protein
MDSEQENQMKQYLLGRLSKDEEVEIERRYLADDTVFEDLLAIEEELRDAYAHHELSGPDREAFERRLLTLPRQKEKQQLANTFRQHLLNLDISPPPAHRKWELLVAVLKAHPRRISIPAVCAALVIVIVGVWLGYRSMRPLMTGSIPGQESQAPKPGEVHEPQAITFTVTLLPGLARGREELRTVVIPAEASRVRFEAQFEGDYPTYQAVLETVEGKQVWSESNLQPQKFPGGMRIFLDLSSSVLASGDYILTVRGLPPTGRAETVAEYTFRIANR